MGMHKTGDAQMTGRPFTPGRAEGPQKPEPSSKVKVTENPSAEVEKGSEKPQKPGTTR